MLDGRQFFRQYESFNQYIFLVYLIQMQKRFRKLISFIDNRTRQHHRSIMVRKYIKQSKDVIKVIYFPKGSSEFNAVEEC
jgi:DDE superfamily endonuclease